MTWWTLDFGPPLGWQAFDRADPTPGQERAALDAVRAARLELPGLLGRPLAPAFFGGPSILRGYWSPGDKQRVWIRSGLSPADTAAVARHEVGHAASHRAYNDVGDELTPDLFAAGAPAAVRALALGFAPEVREAIDRGARAALAARRPPTIRTIERTRP